jgi:hypothetical protein
MKKTLVAGFIIFFTGFFIKFFHIHFNAVVMLVSLLILLVTSVVAIVKKESRVNGWANLAATGWLALLLFTVKFYPFASVVLALAVVFSLVSILRAWKNKRMQALTFPAVCFALALAFHTMPADNKYHLMNIRWSYEADTDFSSWDKYSWFLYQNSKYDEALSASHSALKIARDAGEAEWVGLITEHKTKIEKKSWTTFR